MLMLVGTYTRNTDSIGIYAFECDEGFRRLTTTAINESIDNPSYLVRHPGLDIVYAVNEVGDFEGGGGISTFGCDAEGNLRLLHQTASLGADPCHLAMGADGRSLFVSNYSGGNLAGFPLDADGIPGEFESLVQHAGSGVDPMRQKGPHVHSIALDSSGKDAWVCDLGLDEVIRYPIAGPRLMVERRHTTRLKPGAGPRMMCFDVEAEYAWVINELDNTLIAFGRDDQGNLVELATHSALPAGFTDASYCSHLAISDDDCYLYASNRGHDSIAVFEVGDEGSLRLVQHEPTRGAHPRHFAFSPDQHFLLVANRDSNNIVVFERDTGTGQLAPTGTELNVPAPVCVLFMD